MLLSADARTRSTALLTVESGGRGYALPGAAVLAIEHVRDWTGEEPLDALTLLGLEACDAEQSEPRVVVLAAGEARLVLLVRGTLSLIQPAPEELLALPAAVQSLTPLVSHVAVVAGKPSFFVLSPARLRSLRGSS